MSTNANEAMAGTTLVFGTGAIGIPGPPGTPSDTAQTSNPAVFVKSRPFSPTQE